MEPDTGANRSEDEGRDGATGAGCLTWALWTVVAGMLLSFFSVVYSVRSIDPGILSIGPSGIVAGFPIPFVEFDDPPSTIPGILANIDDDSTVYWTLAAINAVLWVLFALTVAAVLRWRLRPP